MKPHGETTVKPTPSEPRPPLPYANPYLMGVALGLVLLASFLILGAGLGASGGLSRCAAWCQSLVMPDHVAASEYFGAWGGNLLHYYLVFMLGGVFLGGLISAVQARRARGTMERGQRCSRWRRGLFALLGGVLVGFASRLARGCTSGQALTGTAMLLTGSMVFLVFIFVGGYVAAWFVRSQWND